MMLLFCPYTHRFLVADFNVIGERTNTTVTVIWFVVNKSRSQSTVHVVTATTVSCPQSVDLTGRLSALTAAVNGRRRRTSAAADVGGHQSAVDPDTGLQRRTGVVVVWSCNKQQQTQRMC